jgi:hypothetical protein
VYPWLAKLVVFLANQPSELLLYAEETTYWIIVNKFCNSATWLPSDQLMQKDLSDQSAHIFTKSGIRVVLAIKRFQNRKK